MDEPLTDPADSPRAQVLLLGTFHFADRGLDRYKPQPTNMLSDAKQAEIADVVARLAAFGPTKVAVERTLAEQTQLDEEYRSYRAGRLELPPDEVYQIGFRLAASRGHPRVHAANAWDRHYEGSSYEAVQAYAQVHGQEQLLHEWWPRIEASLRRGEQRRASRSLRETLLRLNEESRVVRGHGTYLVDTFKIGKGGDYPGVDLVTGWYNRNLRIFANIQRITHTAEDRLLVIIGAGHLAILRQCLQASLEHDLVEVDDIL